MKVTRQGKRPEEIPSPIPWYLEIENECDDCDARWVIEADDEKYPVFFGAIAIGLSPRSLDLANRGMYHVSPPTDDRDHGIVWSWCPNCGKVTSTEEPSGELLTSDTPGVNHRA